MYMYSLFLTTYLNLETHTRIYCKSCLGAWAKIETVIKNMSVKLFVIVVIVLKPYTKYILFNAR